MDEKSKWTKLITEKDLPKISGKYWIYNKKDDKLRTALYVDGKREFINITEKEWWLKNVTHYQLIQKPKKPTL